MYIGFQHLFLHLNKEAIMAGEVVHADSKPSESMGISMAMFLGGATIGALAALLLAPQVGRESRGQLSEFGRRTGETMREWATGGVRSFHHWNEAKRGCTGGS
jgi:hypothetical protein